MLDLRPVAGGSTDSENGSSSCKKPSTEASSDAVAVENNLSPLAAPNQSESAPTGGNAVADLNVADQRRVVDPGIASGLVHRDSFAESCSFNGSRGGSASTVGGAEAASESGSPHHHETRRMSLLEQKRQQWAAEKAQMNEWNPWGRPGGGAPIGGSSPPIDVKVGRLNDWNKTINSNVETFSVNAPLHITCGYDEFSRTHGSRLPPLPQAIPSPNNSSFGPFAKFIPSSAASSVGFGNHPIQNHPYDAWKEDIKKQWLDDLEKQREEQHLRKVQEKAYYHKSFSTNNINVEPDYLNNLSQSNGGAYATTPASFPSHMPALPTVDENENLSSTMTVVSHVTESNNLAQNNATQRTFLRGANIPLDPQTQSELLKKREKALEQQRAIQFQLDERSRQKQQEKEKRRLEELAEEERLAREREQLEQSYVREQQKTKLKEEADSQKREAIVEAIYASQRAAKVDKDKRRFSQLPDVVGDTKAVVQLPDKDPEERSHSKLDKRAPFVLKDNLLVPTDKTVDSQYVHNRVLTPTKFRDKSPNTRDFATQTDSYPGDLLPLRKDRSTLTTVNIGAEDSDSVFERMSGPGVDKRNSISQSQQRGKSKSSKKVNKQQGRRQRSQPNTPHEGSSPAKHNPNVSPAESNYYNEWRAKQLQQQRTKQQQQQQQQNTPSSRGGTDDAARRSRAAQRNGEQRLSGAGGARTRSSAEHQRKIIAQEGALIATANSQRVCLSPMHSSVRATATGNSSIFEGYSSTGSGDHRHHQPVRKQRRQWESPRRDEMPNFYTDTPQLPDGRQVRRRGGNGSDGTSRRSSEADEWAASPPRPIQQTPTVAAATPPPPVFRSASPPVPALRNRLVNQLRRDSPPSPLSSMTSPSRHRPDSIATSQFGADWLPRRETLAVADGVPVTTISAVASPSKLAPGLTTSQPVLVQQRSSTPGVDKQNGLGEDPKTAEAMSHLSPSHLSIQNSKTFKSTWSLTTPSPEEQEEVLHKLTLVRQGLLIKQLEVESLIANIGNQQKEQHGKKD